MERFNLIVIGGGSAGLMTAAGAAGLGAKVALVEVGKMGGDCLNTGCVPSKALLRCAKEALQADRCGGRAPAWSEVRARIQGVIDTIAPHDSVARFESLGVEVVPGRASLLSPRSVLVTLQEGGERRLDGRAIVIATGSSPLIPPIPGLEAAGYLSNENVFVQPTQPKRLLVMGGGPIGLELGQAFARLGTQTTVVEMLPRILPREDPDAAEIVATALRGEGVEILTGTRVTAVTGSPAGKVVTCRLAGGGERIVIVDEILVAAGRRSNTENLGLEALGVRIAEGRIVTDHRMRTTLPSVYACGDVSGPYQFTHMAGQQARVVIQNALLPFKARMDYRVVPWATFTDPEVARVGLNEQEASGRGIPFRTIKIPFSGNDRAVCDGETVGFLKILTPPGKDVILGATLVGAGAGELVHEPVLAMQAKLRLRDLANTVHIYPTMAEIFRRAGDEARKAGFTPRLQRLFRAYLRWRR